MSHWIPRNKKTGVEYPPVSDAEKSAMESDPQTKGKFTFRVIVEASGTQTVAQTVAVKAKPEKEKLAPVGVDAPKEEKELPQA